MILYTVADKQSPLVFSTNYLDSCKGPNGFKMSKYGSLDGNDKIHKSQLSETDKFKFWLQEIWPYPYSSTKNHRKITNWFLLISCISACWKIINELEWDSLKKSWSFEVPSCQRFINQAWRFINQFLLMLTEKVWEVRPWGCSMGCTQAEVSQRCLRKCNEGTEGMIQAIN